MKLEQLYYLKEAAAYCSISVAAEKNFISQSAVSYAIANLEKELGAPLLLRHSTGVTLTPTGHAVLQKAEGVFRSVEEIRAVAQRQEIADIPICCTPCLCSWLFDRLLHTLQAHDQVLPLTIEAATEQNAICSVTSGLSEFAVLIRHSDLPQHRDLQYLTLFRDEYQLYIGCRSPYWNAKSLTLAQAQQESCIAYRDEHLHRTNFADNPPQAALFPNVCFRTNDLETAKSRTAQGTSILLLPRCLAENDLYVQNGLLRCLPISDCRLHFETGCVTSRSHRMSPAGRALLKTVREALHPEK